MPGTSSKDLASISALELSHVLQNPSTAAPFSHIGTAQLQALRQLSDIFFAALPSGTVQHAPPLAQNSSQFRSTVQQGCTTHTRIPSQPIPATPIIYHTCSTRCSQRVIPSQVPSPRVTPRLNPNDVASPRVTAELPLTDVVPFTPHPASDNAPYIPQGTAGMNLFDTFEEEHMETPAAPGTTLDPEHANTRPIRLTLLPHAFSAPLPLQTTKLLLCPSNKQLKICPWHIQ
jgi:hypothetical protein